MSSFVDPQQVAVTNKASLSGKVIGSVKWPVYNSSQRAAETLRSAQLLARQLTAVSCRRRVCELHDGRRLLRHVRHTHGDAECGGADGDEQG